MVVIIFSRFFKIQIYMIQVFLKLFFFLKIKINLYNKSAMADQLPVPCFLYPVFKYSADHLCV